MPRIQLLKEPGYIYDLNFIFCLKFNKELYISSFKDDVKEVISKHYRGVSALFNDIPDDLYVFFHAIETGYAFFPSCYFNPYKNYFPTTYNFNFLQKELSDHNKLIHNLIKFYFPEINDETVEECASSLNQVFSLIKDSKYSDGEKNKLYEFFIDPTRYIQLLQYELMRKEFLLSHYYQENYQKIIDIYNKITYESLRDQLGFFQEIHSEKTEESMYVSFCLLNKFCIAVWFLEDAFLSLLGGDYTTVLEATKGIDHEPDLYEFGTTIGEESRVKILNFLTERDEVTCKDLEKEFSFSGSTAYHHITIMAKTGLVKTRGVGKTIFYSLNKRYVTNMIHVLNKLLSKKG